MSMSLVALQLICYVERGGIAQLVSHLPLKLGTQVQILNLGHPMHEWEEKRLPALKLILHQLD